MYSYFAKRLLEVLLSFIVLVISLPVTLVISITILASTSKSPFFVQQRPGKNNRIFRLVKFKTMNDKRDAKGKLLPDSVRLTNVGRFVRGFSLDELPQLFNVLKGDMSLIGPRPLLVKYLPRYSDEQARRHKVRPGISGWAQVNGRNAIGWEEKLKLDVWYVDNISFKLDCKILWMTFVNVIKRKGINASLNTTMKEFKGNKY